MPPSASQALEQETGSLTSRSSLSLSPANKGERSRCAALLAPGLQSLVGRGWRGLGIPGRSPWATRRPSSSVQGGGAGLGQQRAPAGRAVAAAPVIAARGLPPRVCWAHSGRARLASGDSYRRCFVCRGGRAGAGGGGAGPAARLLPVGGGRASPQPPGQVPRSCLVAHHRCEDGTGAADDRDGGAGPTPAGTRTACACRDRSGAGSSPPRAQRPLQLCAGEPQPGGSRQPGDSGAEPRPAPGSAPGLSPPRPGNGTSSATSRTS